jgi:CMP-N-acetylneuraminic acid synthetase
MICSLILGRKGSVGFPGKNTYPINGNPMSWYPMMAAKNTPEIDKNYISTDDSMLVEIAQKIGFEIIERPEHLAGKEALGEDAYKHGYEIICKRNVKKPELLVLLFCNAPTITQKQISEGIKKLRADPSADSAVTVSRYNMYSPTRARKISDDGSLQPYIPFEHHPNSDDINCDRDSQGDVWFADVAVSIIRPKNFDNLEDGLPPQRWMGNRILPIYNEAGLDLDYEWQLGQVKWWLEKMGNN